MLSVEPLAWACLASCSATFAEDGFARRPATKSHACWSEKTSQTPSQATMRKASAPLRVRFARSGCATMSGGLRVFSGRAPSARVIAMPPGKTRQDDLRLTLKTTWAPKDDARRTWPADAKASFSLRPQPPPRPLIRAFSSGSSGLWSFVSAAATTRLPAPLVARTQRESPTQATASASSPTTATVAVVASTHLRSVAAAMQSRSTASKASKRGTVASVVRGCSATR
mmetsp:Transcript_30552/g.103785  ORF Transcript_30552/g.103785 Transcript_30552/m.103785 type:complete len:227 (+) Transcript_30552:223-903(+)